jgi:hypothetical protein
MLSDQLQKMRQRNAALKSDLGGAEQHVRDLERQVGTLLGGAAQSQNEMDRLRSGGFVKH